MSRLLRPAALASALAVSLAACTGLPEQTPIVTGRPVGGEVADAIRVQVQGPAPGASPRDVVTGFLRASASFEEDTSVAQQFLAPSAAARWQPRQVVIYESSVQPTVTVTGARASVTVPVTGSLDAEGHYTDLAPGATSRLDLALERVGGQWRIADGVSRFGAMMSRGDFARYADYLVPYATPSGDALVGDRRWFLRGPGLLTRLARAVLEPAPAYLQGAVTTGVPSSTELVGSVAVDDTGTATVQLGDRATDADQTARRVLWTRLVHALQQNGSVARVQVTTGGGRLAVGGLPDRPLTTDDLPLPAVRPRADVALARTRSSLQPVGLPDLGALPASDPGLATTLPRIGPSWYHLALSVDTTEIAGTGGDDRDLARWRAGRRIQLPRVASALTRPGYDRHGILWAGGTTPAGARLLVLDAPAAGTEPVAPTLLAVPWLVGRRVRAVEVADDGQRVVVLSTDLAGRTPRVEVAGVVRRRSVPVSLTTPRELVPGLAEAADVTWVDADTLAVLGRRAGQPVRRVVLVPLNDRSRDLGQVPTGESVTAFGGERDVAVVTTEHTVLVRSGSGFSRQLDARDLAVPGR